MPPREKKKAKTVPIADIAAAKRELDALSKSPSPLLPESTAAGMDGPLPPLPESAYSPHAKPLPPSGRIDARTMDRDAFTVAMIFVGAALFVLAWLIFG